MARAVVLRAEARSLPLPDASVDLIVTSPPYWQLRGYEDGGKPLEGQIGSEDTPQEYLEALWCCTSEWARVLKPEGSMFIDLGDKYDSGTSASRVNPGTVKDGTGQGWNQGTPRATAGQAKSLLFLPERYRIGCVDRLGLIGREVIEWHKPNPIPESARDRCGRTHEDVVHLVKSPRYYSAVDEIRESTEDIGRKSKSVRAGPLIGNHGSSGHDGNGMRMAETYNNPLGKLPGSVWTIPSEPLSLPAYLGVDHYAAFPTALPRKCILGWSPPGICTACGEGRRPVTRQLYREPNDRLGIATRARTSSATGTHVGSTLGYPAESAERQIAGYACACTPYTDHPGSSERGGWGSYDDAGMSGAPAASGKQHVPANYKPKTGPWREYHFGHWTPPPTRPARVLDPFGGTGTTALVAVAHGRDGISCDLGADYSRAAQYRLRDGGERAKARGQAKPAPVKRLREDLYGELTDEWDELLEESS